MPLSLYVHVPFCVSKCHYCDFYSLAVGRSPFPEEELTGAVEQEAQRWERRLLPEQFQTLVSVYFGGGTPSLLRPESFERLLRTAQNRFFFPKETELTLEANPASALEEKLRAFRQAGVNRLSMGFQSHDDDLLKILGRAHSGAEALESLQAAFKVGFDRVSIDLMYGLPHQTLEILQGTLQCLRDFSLGHFSAYELILEEETPFYSNYREEMQPLPPLEVLLEMRQRIEDFALSRDLYRYEISNYAKPGAESRHNRHYWDYGTYLGWGPGAVSLLRWDQLSLEFRREISTSCENDVFAVRCSQPRDLKNYLKSPGEIGFAQLEFISRTTAKGEFMMMGLRKSEGITFADFEKTFEESFTPEFEKILERQVKHGLMEVDQQGCRLTPRGVLLGNEVFQDYLLD